MIPVTVSSKPVPASEDQLTALINGDHYQREFALVSVPDAAFGPLRQWPAVPCSFSNIPLTSLIAPVTRSYITKAYQALIL